jgi:CHAT domain-containing protein
MDSSPNDPTNLMEVTKQVGLCLDAMLAVNEAKALADMDTAALCLQENCIIRRQILGTMGSYLQVRFQRFRAINDLNRSIEAFQRATQVSSANHPILGMYYSHLGHALTLRLQELGLEEDLNLAVNANEAAVRGLPAGHHLYSQSLMNLSESLRRRFQNRGLIKDLDRAVTIGEDAIKWTDSDSHTFPYLLNNLSVMLTERFQRGARLADLNRAIEVNERALKCSQGDVRAMCQGNLGHFLQLRSERNGSEEDLTSGIAHLKSAWAGVSETDPLRSGISTNLGIALTTQFKRTGRLSDLDEAIEFGQAGVKSSPRAHPDRVTHLNDLSQSLHARFKRTGSLEDLERAIQALCEAKALKPPNSLLPMVLANHASILLSRSDRTGSMADLNEAIDLFQDSAKSAQDLPSRLNHLTNLSTALRTRFHRNGSMSDLNLAIEINDKAIQLQSSENQIPPVQMTMVGTALMYRHHRDGSMDDLNRSIAAHEKAVASLSVGNEDSFVALPSLCNALVMRFQRNGLREDVDRAIDLCEAAIDKMAKDHSRRAIVLDTYGEALVARYEHGKKTIDDLNRAIEVGQEAVELMPLDNPNRAAALCNLGKKLVIRFDTNGFDSFDEVSQAIVKLEEASLIAPKDSPGAITILGWLGRAYSRRYTVYGSMDDWKKGTEVFEAAVNQRSAYPTSRINAAKEGAYLLSLKKDPKESQFLKTAVELLPLVTPRTLSPADQQHQLTAFGGLASEAAATLLKYGSSPYEALQLLEIGRGVIASLQLAIRTDITDLETKHPTLAEEFKRLRDELDSANPTHTLEEADRAASERRRRQAASEFEDRITVIRSKPGFKRFLLAPSEEDMKNLATSGPIVFLNVATDRSDAFLVTGDRLWSIPLPALREHDVRENATAVKKAVSTLSLQTYDTARKTMKRVMEWLWDAVVSPVLDELGFKEPPMGDNWQHVWWVSSRWLNWLPLHAAGYHGSTRTTLDRVISSYTPTIKSLAFARERAGTSKKEIKEVLLVAMPQTPNTPRNSPLPNVVREIDSVAKILPNAVSTTALQRPNRAIVFKHLSSCQIVHFACHGQSDYFKPSQSCLLLEDWKMYPLSVAYITSLNLKDAQFAYLSACQAADSGQDALLDEGIHLTGACQLAGFPRVVGTLWAIDDSRSVEVATSVYSSLMHGGGVDVSKAAEGLHWAIRKLREDTGVNVSSRRIPEGDPFIWAPYIHMGM